jgi:hypothetical protein
MFDVRLEITLRNQTGTNGIDQAWDSLYQVVDALGAQQMKVKTMKVGERSIYCKGKSGAIRISPTS